MRIMLCLSLLRFTSLLYRSYHCEPAKQLTLSLYLPTTVILNFVYRCCSFCYSKLHILSSIIHPVMPPSQYGEVKASSHYYSVIELYKSIQLGFASEINFIFVFLYAFFKYFSRVIAVISSSYIS